MTQLDRMKEYVITEIKNMNVAEFMDLSDVLSGEIFKTLDIQKNELFTCTACREKYGDCTLKQERFGGTKVCSLRFERYAKEECC